MSTTNQQQQIQSAENASIDILGQFDAGVFMEKVNTAIKQSSLGTVLYGEKNKVGKVNIEITTTRISESNQVEVKHKLTFSTPTVRGKSGEESTTSTVMYVGYGGVLTVVPDTQQPLFNPPARD
jgi:hypothetical protein